MRWSTIVDKPTAVQRNALELSPHQKTKQEARVSGIWIECDAQRLWRGGGGGGCSRVFALQKARRPTKEEEEVIVGRHRAKVVATSLTIRQDSAL
jgi:hypothetical protein